LWAKVSGDIHEIRQGGHLRVGTGYGRWLPSALRKAEKAIKPLRRSDYRHRQVISREQTLFYVGDDGELHVRSEGYNNDQFIAHPSEIEMEYAEAMAVLESNRRSRWAAGQLALAYASANASTQLLDKPWQPTEYLPRRQERANRGRHARAERPRHARTRQPVVV
jgi:hypothetical protein